MKKSKIQMSTLDVPQRVAELINKRSVDALRVNIEHAATLDENGGQFAWANEVDVATRGWLMMMMEQHGFTAKEALDCYMELLTRAVIPKFLETDFVMASILREGAARDNDDTVSDKVNAALARAGITPEFVIEGDSLDEVLAQLTALRDSQNATKQ